LSPGTKDAYTELQLAGAPGPAPVPAPSPTAALAPSSPVLSTPGRTSGGPVPGARTPASLTRTPSTVAVTLLPDIAGDRVASGGGSRAGAAALAGVSPGAGARVGSPAVADGPTGEGGGAPGGPGALPTPPPPSSSNVVPLPRTSSNRVPVSNNRPLRGSGALVGASGDPGPAGTAVSGTLPALGTAAQLQPAAADSPQPVPHAAPYAPGSDGAGAGAPTGGSGLKLPRPEKVKARRVVAFSAFE
jgi:hypothetical protein